MSDAANLPVDKLYQPKEKYLSVQKDSLRDPESFWAKVAGQLIWHKTWDKVLEWDPPFAQWFVGGTLNASENAVDSHVKSWRKNKAAYLWEGENGEHRTITYGELHREVNRLASVLQNLGFRKGDTVAIYMPLVPEFPITMLACARLGLPFTVVFSGFSAKALAERIQDCEAKIVVTADGGYRRGKILELKTVVDDAVKESPGVKYVVVFRRTGHVVPMIEGRDYWWHDLMAKAASYVAPVPVESTHLLYILYTAPTAIRSLLRHGDNLPKQHDLDSLRLLGTVGEPINPAAWQWYFDAIGQGRCPIVDTWWQTETGGIMISPSPRLGLVPLKAGSATLPLPGVEADVVDERGQALAPGEKGFLVIKKPWPGMFMTLYKDPERYRQVYWTRFPGLYYPGDYAMRDADGYFWLLGRADEVIKVAGHRLGTKEVEDALVSHPFVAEAAVAGRPDPVKGESIVAFVTLRSMANPSKNLSEEMKQHVRRMIGPIATPEAIYFAKILPKTRSGKIMRRVIKAVAAGGPIGDLSTLEDGASVNEIRLAIEALQTAEKTAKSS